MPNAHKAFLSLNLCEQLLRSLQYYHYFYLKSFCASAWYFILISILFKVHFRLHKYIIIYKEHSASNAAVVSTLILYLVNKTNILVRTL